MYTNKLLNEALMSRNDFLMGLRNSAKESLVDSNFDEKEITDPTEEEIIHHAKYEMNFEFDDDSDDRYLIFLLEQLKDKGIISLQDKASRKERNKKLLEIEKNFYKEFDIDLKRISSMLDGILKYYNSSYENTTLTICIDNAIYYLDNLFDYAKPSEKEAIQSGNVNFRQIININFSHKKNVEIYETALENSEVDNEKTIKVIWKEGKRRIYFVSYFADFMEVISQEAEGIDLRWCTQYEPSFNGYVEHKILMIYVDRGFTKDVGPEAANHAEHFRIVSLKADRSTRKINIGASCDTRNSHMLNDKFCLSEPEIDEVNNILANMNVNQGPPGVNEVVLKETFENAVLNQDYEYFAKIITSYVNSKPESNKLDVLKICIEKLCDDIDTIRSKLGGVAKETKYIRILGKASTQVIANIARVNQNADFRSFYNKKSISTVNFYIKEVYRVITDQILFYSKKKRTYFAYSYFAIANDLFPVEDKNFDLVLKNALSTNSYFCYKTIVDKIKNKNLTEIQQELILDNKFFPTYIAYESTAIFSVEDKFNLNSFLINKKDRVYETFNKIKQNEIEIEQISGLNVMINYIEDAQQFNEKLVNEVLIDNIFKRKLEREDPENIINVLGDVGFTKEELLVLYNYKENLFEAIPLFLKNNIIYDKLLFEISENEKLVSQIKAFEFFNRDVDRVKRNIFVFLNFKSDLIKEEDIEDFVDFIFQNKLYLDRLFLYRFFIADGNAEEGSVFHRVQDSFEERIKYFSIQSLVNLLEELNDFSIQEGIKDQQTFHYYIIDFYNLNSNYEKKYKINLDIYNTFSEKLKNSYYGTRLLESNVENIDYVLQDYKYVIRKLVVVFNSLRYRIKNIQNVRGFSNQEDFISIVGQSKDYLNKLYEALKLACGNEKYKDSLEIIFEAALENRRAFIRGSTAVTIRVLSIILKCLNEVNHKLEIQLLYSAINNQFKEYFIDGKNVDSYYSGLLRSELYNNMLKNNTSISESDKSELELFKQELLQGKYSGSEEILQTYYELKDEEYFLKENSILKDYIKLILS